MELGIVYALGAAVTWGLVYTIDQKVLSGIAPVTLLFIDSIMGVILMSLFVFFLDKGFFKDILSFGKSNWFLIILSVVLAAIANFFIFSSIKCLNASTASTMEIAYPFFVMLFSYLYFRTTPNLYFFLGGILIFLGSIIIVNFA